VKMTIRSFFCLTLLLALFSACSSPFFVKSEFHSGIYSGGIVENTDLSVIANIPNGENGAADAFTGATSRGCYGGAKVIAPLGKVEWESGLTLSHNQHEFLYDDEWNAFAGDRSISLTQLSLPLMLRLPLLKKRFPDAEWRLKMGFLGQYNFVNLSGTGILPDFSIENFSSGMALGFSALPWQLKNGAKLGLEMELYRGSRIYTDFYNQAEFEMPGSAYGRLGFVFQPKQKYSSQSERNLK
jgi:hypothetical protein